MICYANAACDSLIKSICYHEAKRGRWDLGLRAELGKLVALSFAIILYAATGEGSGVRRISSGRPHPFPHPHARRPLRPAPKVGFTASRSSAGVGSAHRVRELNRGKPPTTSPLGWVLHAKLRQLRHASVNSCRKRRKVLVRLQSIIDALCRRSALSAAPKPSCPSAAFVSLGKDLKYYCL